MTPTGHWRLHKVKGIPCMGHLQVLPTSPKISFPFALRSLVFQIIKVWDSPIILWYNFAFETFEKKIVKKLILWTTDTPVELYSINPAWQSHPDLTINCLNRGMNNWTLKQWQCRRQYRNSRFNSFYWCFGLQLIPRICLGGGSPRAQVYVVNSFWKNICLIKTRLILNRHVASALEQHDRK